jgi:hypothetical protein
MPTVTPVFTNFISPALLPALAGFKPAVGAESPALACQAQDSVFIRRSESPANPDSFLKMYKDKNAHAAAFTHPQWLDDKIINAAVNEISQLTFDEQDAGYLTNMGCVLPFYSGAEAADFIKKSNVGIAFEKISSKHVHAQYDYDKNLIMLNDIYKNTSEFPVILALAEAILHECGHAKDFDRESSVQEELNNLGMNAVAHRAFLKKYGNDVFNKSDALIIKDGVSVYSKLFFDSDSKKKKLVRRIR